MYLCTRYGMVGTVVLAPTRCMLCVNYEVGSSLCCLRVGFAGAAMLLS